MNLTTKGKVKGFAAAGAEAVVCMACGDGTQVVAKNVAPVPTYPSNNTMFLGEAAKRGLFEEACHFCGDCVLGTSEYGGVAVTGAARRGSVWGVQFHPEKSGEAGLRLLKAFAEL